MHYKAIETTKLGVSKNSSYVIYLYLYSYISFIFTIEFENRYKYLANFFYRAHVLCLTLTHFNVVCCCNICK